MVHQSVQPLEFSVVLTSLTEAYQTGDVELIFVKAYRQCVGNDVDNARFDYRLYRDDQRIPVPAYLERAYIDHIMSIPDVERRQPSSPSIVQRETAAHTPCTVTGQDFKSGYSSLSFGDNVA